MHDHRPGRRVVDRFLDLQTTIQSMHSQCDFLKFVEHVTVWHLLGEVICSDMSSLEQASAGECRCVLSIGA